MKTAMFLLGLVLLASTVEHATAFGEIAQAFEQHMEETHAAIEEAIASKHMQKVAVSGARVSGARVSGARETTVHPLHHLTDLSAGTMTGTASSGASAYASSGSGY